MKRMATPLMALCLSLSLMLEPNSAKALDAPNGQIILTISGNISNRNTATGASFDAPMLKALGMNLIETTTPWHDGAVRFEGPLISDIMATVGASGETVMVTATDGYSVEVPYADFEQFKPILAILRNGEE
ncbi:MAG: oxidoreductase, partial [Rhizobiaceae bacterium]